MGVVGIVNRRTLPGMRWRARADAPNELAASEDGVAAMNRARFAISDLAGLDLSSVCFVRDYVEFHFDGPVLRALSDPAIDEPTRRVQFPEPGSRDVLCALIGMTVVVAEDRGDEIRLDFGTAGIVSIPFWTDSGGPEVAHLVPASSDGRPDVLGMSIWQWTERQPGRER